ncbi:MAG: ATP-dependent Clp protease adaptor ClpS [Thermoanaerobaculia bacterium]|jgi:ATP-dependent Clp protease adaptor protein ClpS
MLPNFDTEESATAEAEDEVRQPPLYRVLIHNDDYTTMDFVVYILEAVFHRSESDAIRLMLQVHQQGVGVAGIFTFEIAEMKAAETMELARANEYPLLCTLDEAE